MERDDEIAERSMRISPSAAEEILSACTRVTDAWNEEYFETPVSARQLAQRLAAGETGRANQQVTAISKCQGDRVRRLLADIETGAVEFQGLHEGRVVVRAVEP